MNSSRHCSSERSVLLALAALIIGVFAAGCGPKAVSTGSASALGAYVSDAKQPITSATPAEGSLWTSSGRRSDLLRDPKAHDINDLVTIRVIESTSASAEADASNSRNTEAQAGVDHVLGLEKKIKELATLTGGKTSSKFEGKGATSRVTTVQANVAARVIDVLPNGYLVVEAVKEIHLNNENQRIFVTGVIRPEDISRNNVVLSSDVAQMTVKIQGRGVVSQPLRPGWLHKILTGILPF